MAYLWRFPLAKRSKKPSHKKIKQANGRRVKKARLKASERRDRHSFILPTNDVTKEVPAVNMPKLLKAIGDKDQQVWDVFIEYMTYFHDHHYKQYGITTIKRLNQFVHCLFTAMALEGFNPTHKQALSLIQMNHLIQHLVASTSYQTTDTLLDSVMSMSGNVPKILALQNPRCKIQIRQDKLFDSEPYLASLWYLSYLLGVASPTADMQRNMHRHLQEMDERWTPCSHVVSGLYFTCTYHNVAAARRVKGIINKGIKNSGNIPEFENSPNPKSIAIITNKWHRNHAVYKSQSTLVEQLCKDYKLTLIWTGQKKDMPPTAITDYFDTVANCYFTPRGELIIPPELKSNDFQVAYFPDIGMTDESIWLSNCRIAPVQVVGYGHPDTTGDNNEIDYFICGDVEVDADDSYSETRVCLPGLAQEPAWPTAKRKNNYTDDGVVRINCVWGPDKYNHTLLTVLAEINKTVLAIDPESKHEFHLFSSPGINRYAAVPPFLREVRKLLPNATLHNEQEYFDYMENAEQHDFSLNSFPFGCYNVLIESLWMGLPFLTLVGDRFYNRAGMWLNEQIGMEENNFTIPRELVTKAAELITQPEELKRQRLHLDSIDLKEALFTLKGDHFLEAIEYILTNHPFTETKVIGHDETNDEESCECQEGHCSEETDTGADREEAQSEPVAD